MIPEVKELRSLRLLGATGTVREDKFNGKDYVVVPVVALVEGVIHASNAENPEFVPADVIHKSVLGWNGRPVMLNHPIRDGVNVSANIPEVLESESFGILFGAGFTDNKLTYEAWLDAEKAAVVGSEAEGVITRAKEGKPIEVSIGAFVAAEKKSGTYNGKKYAAQWTLIVPDHLAMLEEGVLGACSNQMGCGVRAASKYRITADGRILEEGAPVADENPEIPKPDCRTLRQRLTDMLVSTFRAAKDVEDMSDREIRSALYNALYASVPAFAGIDDVLSGQNLVIYAVYVDNTYKVFQQSYAIGTDGKATLSGSPVEGRIESSFVPLSATTPVTAASGGSCGCGGSTTKRTAEHKEHPMTKEERIAALLGKNKRFKQTDAKWLSALPEEHLAALEAEQPEPATTPAPEVKPEPKPETPTTPETLSAKPQTVADYIANAPAEVADILRSAVATQNAVKATTIKALKDTGRCDLTDAELQAMPIGQLRSLAKMANVATTEAPTDFSLNIPPRVADSGDESIPAPASMVDAFRAAKK